MMVWDRARIILHADIREMTRVETVVYGVFNFLVAFVAGLFVFVIWEVFDRVGGLGSRGADDDDMRFFLIVVIWGGRHAYESYALAREEQATGKRPDTRREVLRAAIYCGAAFAGAMLFLNVVIDRTRLSADTFGEQIVLALIGGLACTAVYAVLWRRWNSGRQRGVHEPGAPGAA